MDELEEAGEIYLPCDEGAPDIECTSGNWVDFENILPLHLHDEFWEWLFGCEKYAINTQRGQKPYGLQKLSVMAVRFALALKKELPKWKAYIRDPMLVECAFRLKGKGILLISENIKTEIPNNSIDDPIDFLRRTRRAILLEQPLRRAVIGCWLCEYGYVMWNGSPFRARLPVDDSLLRELLAFGRLQSYLEKERDEMGNFDLEGVFWFAQEEVSAIGRLLAWKVKRSLPDWHISFWDESVNSWSCFCDTPGQEIDERLLLNNQYDIP